MTSNDMVKQKRAELEAANLVYQKSISDLKTFVRKCQILPRVHVCKRIYKKAIKDMVLNNDAGIKIRFNDNQLFEALRCYWNDIDRLKNFHGISYANEPKKAAYMIKWIVKFKPISYSHTSITNKELEQTLISINEYYALLCAFHYTKISLTDLHDDIIDEFIYNLRYREVRADSMMIWFDTYYITHNLERFKSKFE